MVVEEKGEEEEEVKVKVVIVIEAEINKVLSGKLFSRSFHPKFPSSH